MQVTQMTENTLRYQPHGRSQSISAITGEFGVWLEVHQWATADNPETATINTLLSLDEAERMIVKMLGEIAKARSGIW